MYQINSGKRLKIFWIFGMKMHEKNLFMYIVQKVQFLKYFMET